MSSQVDDSMNSTTPKKRPIGLLAAIGILLLLLVIIPFGITGVLTYLDANYFIPAIGAIISFTFAGVFIIRQKQTPISSAIAIIVGILFLGSSVIELGFSAFERSLSIYSQAEFSMVLRPNQISHGLADLGTLLAIASLVFARFRQDQVSNITDYRILHIFYFGICILLFIMEIYSILDGFLYFQ